MFAVHFFEKRDAVLSQLLKRVPEVGEELKIKGRKGKVLAVTSVGESVFHVDVQLETVKKTALWPGELSKKKKK